MRNVLFAAAIATVVAVAVAPNAAAQDRPTEGELFGKPQPQEAAAEEQPAATPPGEAAPAAEPPRPGGGARVAGEEVEAELFGSSGSPAAQPPPPGGLVDREGDDRLGIGGQLYLRAATVWQEDVPAADWSLSSSNLLDLYADARPNDRVRAFALGRMFYDPTLARDGAGGPFASALGGLGLVPLPPSNPRVVLDQLWVNFDVNRRVFVTAGKQHVKWGVGKFWNPTDYLHPVKRDPLAVFDERAGTTMLRVHVPWERRGWNAYGVAFLEDVAGRADATDRLGRVALGGRVEAVVGTLELGLDALAQDGSKPRYGIDVSAGIWELDLYAELALQSGTDAPRWRRTGGPVFDTSDPLAPRINVERADPTGDVPRLVLGGSWGRNYTDDDVVYVGAEWFWQRGGYDDEALYPFLLAGAPALTGDSLQPLVQEDPRAFTPFYLGEQYAGAFVSLPAPGSWDDTTFTLSVLGNLSDRSFVARLDHSILALTYLRIETFVAASFGNRGGEFRLAVELPTAPALSIEPPVLQAGIAARMSL